ncbi:[nife]-hydrogenase small subunit [Lucifera butyrica]|uniref:[nife]-hydrogenase small subunit n=1 Tax=Lucifera butyrica TaxID=1351585 RepID=A0A498R7A7_9FIRM|nr:hydrogenase small subunit [Lucifera butyrica]VBB06810.1 [nife]-hydrogenase small subunit [Lucifera butyrica]
MGELNSLWDIFQNNKLSRRQFIKTCVALTSIMGLSTTMIPKVIEAAEKKALVPVIWLHGHECTGCDEALLRSQTPLASDLVLNTISLEYTDVLAAAAGEPLEDHLAKTMQQYRGQYILAVEGAVPVGNDGVTCMVGGKPFVDNLRAVAQGAAAVLAYGSCASWGGIQAAKPNPTHSVAVTEVLPGKTVVRVPGCPPIPEVMTGVIMHYALFGQIPPLDSQGRPAQFYGNRIHDTCYRRPFFDSGMFAETYDGAGSKAGWCLYKLGCRGPETYNSCGNMRWWNGLSYPIQSGAPCIGCAEKDFWDHAPFSARLPQISLPNTIADADKVGLVAAGVAGAGVVAHGVASVIQHQKMQNKTVKEDPNETHCN